MEINNKILIKNIYLKILIRKFKNFLKLINTN